MEQKLSQAYLVIEKVQRAAHPQGVDTCEFLARVPFESGTYQTDKGALGVVFHARDNQNRMKIVLTGEVVPTVKKRGKPGQFRKVEQPRRVVNFPMYPGGLEKQDTSSNEYLLFRKEEVIYTAE